MRSSSRRIHYILRITPFRAAHRAGSTPPFGASNSTRKDLCYGKLAEIRRRNSCMPVVTTENHTLAVADGTSMNAFVALPAEKGLFPGMLVFQEAFGVNGHIRDVAQRLAREGYVAIAPELYHRTAPSG